MNLQRISDFAENQEGRSCLFDKYPKSPDIYMRKFSPR
jgi:hypothetical protein